MTTELRRAFDAARAGSEERSYIFGLLGKPDGTVAVSGQPGYLYVRVSNEADRTLTTARNPYAVPQRAGLPVKMRRERDQLVILGIDASRLYDATTTGDTVNPYGVAKHTHLLGTGLEYTVESLRMEPGQLYPAGGLLAGVRAFRYYYSGAWVTFEGDTISLGTYRPSTVGHHAWVLVGVDPTTNTIVAVAGTSQIYATPLTISQIDSITFTGYIPIGAVKVRNDDTEVTDITKYQDAHEWFGVPVGGVNFLDAEGNPADVTSAAADGTSVYAARRDHAHTIAAATVTNAMRANMAQTTVSGRAAGAGTGVPTDLSAAQLVAIIATADGAGSTLDADTLDTLNSTAFFILAGQAGGQTAIGGTAASEKLILRGTAHATAGIVETPDVFRITGVAAPAVPATGVGLELFYDTDALHSAASGGGGAAFIRSFDRGGTAWKDMLIQAEDIGIWTNGFFRATWNSSGHLVFENSLRLEIDEVRARDTGGLALYNDGGVGMTILDSNEIIVGTATTATVGGNNTTAMLEIYNTVAGQLLMQRESANSGGPTAEFLKRRSGFTISQDGDTLGDFVFSGTDGDQSVRGAEFYASVDGTPGNNSMPGRLVFATTSSGNNFTSERMRITSQGNLGFGITNSQFGSGQQVIGVQNAAVNPSTNPSGGGVLYADAGAGKWRGSSGTTTTFGVAEPHCPVCGCDYAVEFDNPNFGYFSMCLRCLADSLGAQPWITRDKSRLS